MIRVKQKLDERTLKRLEYDKVLERLAGYCETSLGRERVFALRPSTVREEISRAQAETTEGRKLLRLEPLAETGGWSDIRRQVERARQGAALDPQDLLNVGQTLAACRLIKNFLSARRERYPLMGEMSASLGSFTALEKKIASAILPGPEISDRASSALAGIRRQLVRVRQQIKEQLEKIIRSPAYQKYLQEPLITMREERYVIPVKQEFRAQVRGIIHDQSASGATVFIEPMAVVEANNEIRRLQAAEKQEITKILSELSSQVAVVSEEIHASLDALGHLDFIMARARYSQALDAWEPRLVLQAACFNFRKARHPLLAGEVVPSDITLGRDFDILVVTGPNTGGKTVAIKTAGLLTLMAQSGLHIPAEDTTELGIFQQVFADIGDEQSIEQSLSTFSSHMNNIIYILKEASSETLVLLDELGAGTDPVEGAALAQAVLERLQNVGAKVIATTHYAELKGFAHGRDGVENACLEFDAITLRPIYRLLIGRPGMSQAFEIALRLGMDAGLVERAKNFLTREEVEIADLMNHLERNRQEMEKEREEVKCLLSQAQTARERYKIMEKDLLTERQAVMHGAFEEARQVVRQTRREAEEAIRQFRTRLAEESARAREKAIFDVRRKIQGISGRICEEIPQTEPENGEIPAGVAVGQEVYLPLFNQRGQVIAPVENGNVQVQVGVVKLTLPVKELRLAEKEPAAGGQVYADSMILNKAKEISPQVDLRGLRAEEALLEVEKYLDDAGLAGLSRVCLIHGKGTGVLRAAIRQHLKEDRRVKSFRLGEHGEGGAGVTVVELT